MMNTGIYTITNLVNGKLYIGSACNFTRRFWSHKNSLKQGNHRNKKLQRSWDKYGGEKNFSFKKILICAKCDLLFYEQLAIDGLNAVKNGYNINPTAGSRAGTKHSNETKSKVSASLKIALASPEMREKKSEAMRIVMANPNARTKISIANKGSKRTIDARAKMAAVQTGRKHSPESIAKQVATRLENNAKKVLAGIKVYSLESIAKQKATKAITRAAKLAAQSQQESA